MKPGEIIIYGDMVSLSGITYRYKMHKEYNGMRERALEVKWPAHIGVFVGLREDDPDCRAKFLLPYWEGESYEANFLFSAPTQSLKLAPAWVVAKARKDGYLKDMMDIYNKGEFQEGLDDG